MSSPSKSIAKSFILSIVKNFFLFFFFALLDHVQFVSVNKMEIHICFELDIKCLKGDLERK